MKQETFGICLSAVAVLGVIYAANEFEVHGAFTMNALICLILSIALAVIGNKLTNHEDKSTD